jgi:hypothetical protein
MCAYGDFVEGFVRGFDWGIIRRFALEDRPHHLGKPQDTPGTGGSPGIPDSLDHKPASTSGPAAWSRDLNKVSFRFEFLSLPCLLVVTSIVPSVPFVIRLAGSPHWKPAACRFHGWADLRNRRRSHRLTSTGNQSVRTLEMAAPVRAVKSHEIGGLKLLPFRLDRATFDVSPGNGKTPKFHTRREPCPTTNGADHV